MRILVTGGTGLLGNNLLRQLTRDGHDLVTLVRGQPDPQVCAGIETEFARGELSDAASIGRAAAGCDAVIHSAGLIHLGWTRMDESMRVNRDGTRVVVDACREHGCKLVHVGTVNTLAIGSRQRPADETTPLDSNGGQVPSAYVLSKRAGVSEVLRGVEQGLRAVIVHPGFMLGPWDWKPSSGRMIVEVGRGWKPLAPSGGCSVCDPRDVAAGTIAALHAEVDSGRQYILAGENWTYLDLWTEMARGMGKRPPWKAAKRWHRWIGAKSGDLWTTLRGVEADVNGAGVQMSSQYHWHDSGRAIAELGYRNRSARESLEDAVAWIKTHHHPGDAERKNRVRPNAGAGK